MIWEGMRQEDVRHQGAATVQIEKATPRPPVFKIPKPGTGRPQAHKRNGPWTAFAIAKNGTGLPMVRIQNVQFRAPMGARFREPQSLTEVLRLLDVMVTVVQMGTKEERNLWHLEVTTVKATPLRTVRVQTSATSYAGACENETQPKTPGKNNQSELLSATPKCGVRRAPPRTLQRRRTVRTSLAMEAMRNINRTKRRATAMARQTKTKTCTREDRTARQTTTPPRRAASMLQRAAVLARRSQVPSLVVDAALPLFFDGSDAKKTHEEDSTKGMMETLGTQTKMKVMRQLWTRGSTAAPDTEGMPRCGKRLRESATAARWLRG